jgi:hypothetical protein
VSITYADLLQIRIRGLELDLAEAEAAPRPDAEVEQLGLLCRLAVALLERYDLSGDPADLDRAIDLLLRTTRLFVDHPALPVCYWWLTHAYGERAYAGGGLIDYDRAIAWAEHLRDGLAVDDPDRDDVVVHLLDMVWDRSWELRYKSDPGAGVDAAYADIGSVVGHIGTVRLSGYHRIAERYVRLMLGAAYLERYSSAPDDGDRADLDAGIAAAAPALAELAAGVPDASGLAVGDWVGERRLALVGGLLSAAYLVRFKLDADPTDIDRAVTAAREAVARYGVDTPPTTFLLSTLAEAVQESWRVRETPADLDAAIDTWALVLAGREDRWAAYDRAGLLVERADRNQDGSDAREAAVLFEHVATITEVDAYVPWYRASEANRLWWKLDRVPEALSIAADQLDRVLAADLEPGDDLLDAYIDRLAVERDRVDTGLVPSSPADGYGRSVLRDLLTAAHRAFDRSAYADPDLRARFAVNLAITEIAAIGHDHGDYDVGRMRALLILGTTARDIDPEGQAFIDLVLGWVETLAGVEHTGAGGDAGVARLARLATSDLLPENLRANTHSALAMSMDFRATTIGDRRAGRIGRRALLGDGPVANVTGQRRGPADADWPTGRSEDPVLDVFLRIEECLQNGDLAGLADLVTLAKPVLDAVPVTSRESELVRFIQLLGVLTDLVSTPLVVLPPITATGPGYGLMTQLMISSMSAGILALQAIARDDLAALEAAATYAGALLAHLTGQRARLRLGVTFMAGLTRLELARRRREPGPDAVEAAGHYAAAMGYVRDHRHTIWAHLATARAEAMRLAGEPDRRRSRELGMSAMRGHAWHVFIQSGTDYALAAARDAAQNARTVADWCVQDRDADPAADDDLVAVLDAGRALVLRAATSARSVADQLAEHGFGELADEWRATGGLGRNRLTGAALSVAADPAEGTLTVPDELRLKALRALGSEGDVIGLRPVSVAEIQAALGATGTDALVHLIPGTDGKPGRAVIVPATGRLVVRTLPALRTGPESPLQGFVPVPAVNRDAQVLDAAAPRTDLDELCAWAWTAAMGDVLRFTARRHDRPVRLVLLPFGMLGLVPWHAACTRTRDGRRYAIEEAVISYSPSARMFCDGGAYLPTPIRSALVVGDPGGDLRFAAIEARAIHSRFYPDGSYLGRTGTPRDVLDWIGSSPAGPSILHFACHAAIDSERPAEARLILGGGEELSAGELLERSRSAALDIEQVFLAACTTSITGSDHDEVFSLATSFLAAGARTVFGSLWPVPDTETSLLMFMVHRFLRVDGCPPADALHRAQLWMLSPQREIPPDLPVELRGRCHVGVRFDPVAWAGFTHYGR